MFGEQEDQRSRGSGCYGNSLVDFLTFEMSTLYLTLYKYALILIYVMLNYCQSLNETVKRLSCCFSLIQCCSMKLVKYVRKRKSLMI